MALLDVQDLSIRFRSEGKLVTAVDRLSFSIAAGETLSLVGESGCGKSVTAQALLRILPSTAKVEGKILFEDKELTTLSERGMRSLRGNRISYVFQDPMSALNPVMTIGAQIVEAIRAHRRVTGTQAGRLALDLLDHVQIPNAAQRFDEYPHRLSGGMRQRVAIAMALAGEPGLLIADEPTTALDVTIQAQILSLLHRLQRELGMALILITHDLGVVAEMADRVLVMYAGRAAESQDVRGLFRHPLHPYTQRLIAAKPRLEAELGHTPGRLQEIPGLVPVPAELADSCAFASRCDLAMDRCRTTTPAWTRQEHGAAAACHLLAPTLEGSRI